MRFMMLVIPKRYEKAGADFAPPADLVAKMTKYNDCLTKAGVLLGLGGLRPPATGARVRFSGGKPKVTDGPFTEAKEVLGGYWMIQEVPGRSDRMGEARAHAGRRHHRSAPGAGDLGLPARRPEGRGEVSYAIPFDREVGREPGASAPGAPGRHGQAHRGLPQGWLPDPDRRTLRELDGRTPPGLRWEADGDRRALHRGQGGRRRLCRARGEVAR